MEIQKKVQGTDHPEMMEVQKDYDELLQKMHHTPVPIFYLTYIASMFILNI
jgi:hypothetical protein